MTYQELMAQAKIKATDAKAMLAGEAPDNEKAKELLAEANGLRERAETVKAADAIISDAETINRPVLPTGNEDPADPISDKDAAVKAFATIKYGEESAAINQVLNDLHGGNYQQKRYQKAVVFNRWLRDVTNQSIPAEGRQMVLTPETVKAYIRDGVDIHVLKSTMVEAQDSLGGFLVPEDFRAELVSRLPGMTVVRSRARVIPTSRDSVELPKRTGGGDQYTGAVRATWVEEEPASTAADTNATFGMVRIPVHTLMLDVPISRNLVEDAAVPLSEFLIDEFAPAVAINEDNAFLVGTGAGKPQGILPGSANDLSLTGVTSTTTTSTFTYDDVKSVPWQIGAQYRQNAVWIAEKATYAHIDTLKDGIGNYLWNRSNDGTKTTLNGYEWFEQETLPTIGSSTYPVLFGDLKGYAIADRIGMSVERYLDSATASTNTVKYVVRRRVGGMCLEPYRFTFLRCMS